MITKIAIPTDDGESVSQHFGQARAFKVFCIENKQVTATETREKARHMHGAAHPAGQHPGQQMVAVIADCQVLIVGGMGMPAFTRATTAGLEVFLTGQTSIQSAIQAYLAGTLDHDPARMHSH